MGEGGDGDKTESDQLSLEPVFLKRHMFPAFVKPNFKLKAREGGQRPFGPSSPILN